MASDVPKLSDGPFPTLLTKSDAMLYAASALEEMTHTLTILHMLRSVIGRPEVRDKIKAATGHDPTIALEGIVDYDLQHAAMAQAVAEIRAQARELKLVEARAGRDGIKASAP